MSSLSWLFKFSLLNRKPRSLKEAKQIHALLITTGLKSTSTLGKLIEDCCALSPKKIPHHAHLIVNHESDGKVLLLNTLIKCSKPRDSILLFANWVSNFSDAYDDHTFIFTLGACARLSSSSALCEGKQIHARALKLGFMSDLMVSTTVVHFYASNEAIGSARKMFDEMPVKSSVTWNALITGYSSQKRNTQENSVMALMYFKEMLADESNAKPNGTTMVCVLPAASRLGALDIGSCIHGYIVKTIAAPEKDVYVSTGLLDMYSKCGCLNIASKVFYMMKETNVLTWTAMATGLAFHGRGKEAMELLGQMKSRNIMPNAVTFTSVFAACCHAGLIEEGLHLFHNMEREFAVKPRIEHYGCIADLLGRGGHLREAYDFVIRMPIRPDPILWRSLLGSCRLHGDTQMGEKVGRILIRAQADAHLGDIRAPSQDYIALSNVYALAGRWQDVGMVRGEMKIMGVEIKPGSSAIH